MSGRHYVSPTGCSLRVTVGRKSSIHAVMPRLTAALGTHHAVDDRTALFSNVRAIPAGLMGRIARELHDVVDAVLTSEGDVVVLEDGRRFKAEAGSWSRVEA